MTIYFITLVLCGSNSNVFKSVEGKVGEAVSTVKVPHVSSLSEFRCLFADRFVGENSF